MPSFSDTRYLAELFRALSEETRVQMMVLLLDGRELCVCDFVNTLGITQSKASRHLRCLLTRGLLEDRRDGVWVRYRIRMDADASVRAALHAVGVGLKAATRSELSERLASGHAHKQSDRPAA
jgi:DNA-binding transcriptional ArsR family regulator